MCLEPTVQLLCSAFSVYSVLSVQNVYTAHQNYPFFKFQLPTKIQSFHYEGLEGPLLEIMQSGITTTDFKNHEPLNNDLITPSVFHVFPYCLLFICYLEYGRIFTLLNLKRKKRLSTLLLPVAHGKVTNLTDWRPEYQTTFSSHIQSVFSQHSCAPLFSFPFTVCLLSNPVGLCS